MNSSGEAIWMLCTPIYTYLHSKLRVASPGAETKVVRSGNQLDPPFRTRKLKPRTLGGQEDNFYR